MKRVVLREHALEDGAPPLFLPDIGTFFNKDLAVAEDLMRRLHAAGARFVKGEILHEAGIALDDSTEEAYLSRSGRHVTERYRDLIERKVVPLDAYARLYRLCRDLDMGLVLSVYDFGGATFARDIGACALKIASSNIVHQPLIEHAARLGLPLVIDTGKSSLEEMARAVQWAEDAGVCDIVIEHSPEAPPAPLANHNLRMLATLRTAFDRPVGLSDHHAGDEMLYAAVALGAQVLEKGVCPDGLEADQDVHHALPIGQVAEVLAKCRRIHTALGSGMRYLRREREKYVSRMGLAAAVDLRAGDRLGLGNVRFAFPARGIPVEHWEIVAGWSVRRPVRAGQVIRWEDVEPVSS